MVRLSYLIVRRFPEIKRLVEKAHMKETPEQFVKRVLIIVVF